jgi:hypothetical protein
VKVYFTLQVLIPSSVYSGQKLIKLVKAKITATNPSTIAKVPLMMSRKYKTAITAAMLNLMSLSVLPMFFVMILNVLTRIIH